jgi:hypothetical protein
MKMLMRWENTIGSQNLNSKVYYNKTNLNEEIVKIPKQITANIIVVSAYKIYAFQTMKKILAFDKFVPEINMKVRCRIC